MTKINFEDNGFTLEQKLNGKNSKTFIYFDYVSNKTGYHYNSINYFNILFIIMFGLFLFIDIKNNNIGILFLFYIVGIIFFVYDIIKNAQKYKTLSLTNSRDIYFPKKESKYIDEIINKRNKYFREKYFLNIETYSENEKIETINWLYNEKVINKLEIQEIKNIMYNEAKDEFYL
jgi:hypothetical protein